MTCKNGEKLECNHLDHNIYIIFFFYKFINCIYIIILLLASEARPHWLTEELDGQVCQVLPFFLEKDIVFGIDFFFFLISTCTFCFSTML